MAVCCCLGYVSANQWLLVAHPGTSTARPPAFFTRRWAMHSERRTQTPMPMPTERPRPTPRPIGRRLHRDGGRGGWQRNDRRFRDEARRDAERGEDEDEDEDGEDGQDPGARQAILPRRQRASVAGLVAAGFGARCLARHASGPSPGFGDVDARRQLGEGRAGLRGAGPETRLRLHHVAAQVCYPSSRASGLSRGAEAEGPGEKSQRADDQQRERRDREVENQSHGARRVADRPFNGRCAWVARQCR